MTRLPLEHIRIIDLTQAWAGSYALQLLADFGAEVIKIESRSRPDPWRGGFEGHRGLNAYPVDGPGERPYNRSYLANSVNRNKYAITLDLASNEGRELFLELVRGADVVSENFTPRVLNNLGIGLEQLRAVQPNIILLSMPAFGLSGPYSDYPGIGGTVEPMSGNAWLLGENHGDPQVSGVMYPDAVAGLNGAAAVLTALYARENTGEGEHVEVSQHEAMIAMLGEFFARGAANGAGAIANRDFRLFPNGIYRAAGEDSWLALSVRDDADWSQLRSVVPGLPECRPDSNDGGASAEIDLAIGCWTAVRSAEQGEECLRAAGVPAGRVRSVPEVLDCPQLSATGYWQMVEQPESIGTVPMPGTIARLQDTPGDVRLPPARHGEHSAGVLQRMLGLSDERITDLFAREVSGEGPPRG
jgi:crotonobetainyl-CoA:carnitine CoA-transferase CaiB-like acyl-CoA transferase